MRKLKTFVIGTLFFWALSNTKAQDCMPIIQACDSVISSQDREIEHLIADRNYTRNALILAEEEIKRQKKQLSWQKTKAKISEIALIIMAICGAIALITD